MDGRERLVRQLFDGAWSEGRTSDLPQAIGEMVFHYAGADRRMTGQQLADLIDRWREGFPDLRFEIRDLVAQDDRIATRCRLTGTHRGEWRGRPPTGQPMDIDVMMFFRFEDDRLVEVWEVDDALRREQQLAPDERAGPGGRATL